MRRYKIDTWYLIKIKRIYGKNESNNMHLLWTTGSFKSDGS
jgi:hypothetical protein